MYINNQVPPPRHVAYKVVEKRGGQFHSYYRTSYYWADGVNVSSRPSKALSAEEKRCSAVGEGIHMFNTPGAALGFASRVPNVFVIRLGVADEDLVATGMFGIWPASVYMRAELLGPYTGND